MATCDRMVDKAIYSGLYATFFFIKHGFPYLKEAQGPIIDFASGVGLSENPGQSSYGDAERDIGRVCVSLGSEDAKYVTGDTR